MLIVSLKEIPLMVIYSILMFYELAHRDAYIISVHIKKLRVSKFVTQGSIDLAN